MKKLIIVSILSLIFSLNTYSQRLYEEQALEVGIKSINNFREFLSLKNDANKLRDWHWMWSYFYFYKKNYNYIYALWKVSGKFFKST